MRRIVSISLAALAVAIAPACSATHEKTASASAAPAANANASFDALLDEVTRDYFQFFPEQATGVGAPTALAGVDFSKRLNDRSIKGDQARRAMLEASLQKIKATNAAGLDAAHAQLRATLIAQYEGVLAPARVVSYGSVAAVYGSWFSPYAAIQNAGAVVDVPNLLQSQQPLTSAADAEDYLSRLSAYGPVLDDVLAKLRADAAAGVVAPDFILQKTQDVIAAFTAEKPENNALIADFTKKLTDAKVDGVEAFTARAVKILAEEVYPAEARLAAELGAEQKTATHDAGIWRLPKGAALYQAMIRQMTDTDMTADEVHQKGLDEVARITGEMDKILKANGYASGTVGERMIKLAKEKRFFYPNTPAGKAQILDDINGLLTRVNARLPEWFGVTPKYPLAVRPVPAFSEASAPGGYYDGPALDGSRPGTYWINLRDTAIWPKFSIPTLTYHEAIPGHHLQGAIALGQKGPLLLNLLYSNAYAEGWALYAEALAKEMGLYDGDPYGDLGRLKDELHRAVRLVVDTGMHAKKWSREQAIDYMVKTEGAHPKEAESEIERYVVWPGQALGYKIGMLKIEELRAKAQAELGDRFDIKAFHDAVLTGGSLPLGVLADRVDAYVAAAKAAK